MDGAAAGGEGSGDARFVDTRTETLFAARSSFGSGDGGMTLDMDLGASAELAGTGIDFAQQHPVAHAELLGAGSAGQNPVAHAVLGAGSAEQHQGLLPLSGVAACASAPPDALQGAHAGAHAGAGAHHQNASAQAEVSGVCPELLQHVQLLWPGRGQGFCAAVCRLLRRGGRPWLIVNKVLLELRQNLRVSPTHSGLPHSFQTCSALDPEIHDVVKWILGNLFEFQVLFRSCFKHSQLK